MAVAGRPGIHRPERHDKSERSASRPRRKARRLQSRFNVCAKERFYQSAWHRRALHDPNRRSHDGIAADNDRAITEIASIRRSCKPPPAALVMLVRSSPAAIFLTCMSGTDHQS